MGFNFENLDDDIRNLMLDEIDMDIKNNTLYLSKRLNYHGQSKYPELLKKAIIEGNDSTLAADLRYENYWEEKEPRRTRNGIKYTKVPSNANETLAEGEFNRFYIRAMCRKSILNGNELQVCRSKQVRNPRQESEAIIGKSVDSKSLLKDLQNNIGKVTLLGVPAGPNSGLSVRFK